MTFLPVQPPSFTLFERSGRAVFQLHMPGLQPLAYISFTSVTSFVNYDLNLSTKKFLGATNYNGSFSVNRFRRAGRLRMFILDMVGELSQVDLYARSGQACIIPTGTPQGLGLSFLIILCFFSFVLF